MIRVKRERQNKGIFFPIDVTSRYVFFAKTWEGVTDYFIRKYEKIEGFVWCQKFPHQPRKILEHGLGLYNKISWNR